METGWIIERADVEHAGCTTGLALGVCDSGRLRWSIADFALRFARDIDAYAAARVLVPNEDVIAVEHSWR